MKRQSEDMPTNIIQFPGSRTTITSKPTRQDQFGNNPAADIELMRRATKRLHQPGRFCDKRDGKPQLLVLLMASVLAAFSLSALVYSLLTH